jgi:hypothetical protein
MAKESGLGWTTSEWDDSSSTARDIKNDITNISWSMPRGIQDTTGLDKSARETLLLLADFSLTANGVFNDATNASHDVLKTVASATVAREINNVISGQTLSVTCNVTDYQLSRSTTGEFTWTAPAVLQDGNAPTWA